MNHLWFCAQIYNAVALDHGIEREGRPTLSLTPLAVTAVDKEWLRVHAIANGLAIASAFDWEFSSRAHVRGECSDA